MAIFKRQRKNKSINSESLNSQKLLLEWLGLTGVDEENLSEATYFACLKVLSESVGKLPFKLQRADSISGVKNLYDDPLYQVACVRPNKYTTATSFWSTVEYNRSHYGNAFVWIQGAGSTMQLWILPSNEVEIWKDDAKILSEVDDIFYIYSHGGHRYYLASEEVLHFKSSCTFDGIVGISVAEQLASTVEGSKKAQKLVNKMYDSGFTAKAVLNYTGDLSDKNAHAFVKGIEQYAKGEMKDKGVENIIPIPLGATLTPLNVKLADNQFIEVKQYTALQIAAAFGIKPSQIGDYTKSSFASAEAQQLSFYVDTLLYILKQYEEETDYKLLDKSRISKGDRFKFNVGAVLRADTKTQVDSLCQGIGSFLYTPNEARAFLDLPAKPGGDRLLGNGASIPVELTGSQYTSKEDGKEEDNAEDKI